MRTLVLLLVLIALGCPSVDPGSLECLDQNEGCAPGLCGGESGIMLPGAECLACHQAGAVSGEQPPEFSIAGTVYTDALGQEALPGATVRITEGDGGQFELVSNAVGNFYTSRAVLFPIQAEIELAGQIIAMTTEQSTGACNSCHACGGATQAKIYGP